MNLFIQLSSLKNYFLGLATSGVVFAGGLYYFNSNDREKSDSQEYLNTEFEKPKKTNPKSFNPNHLTDNEWRALGFSEKQVTTILKYKQVVGGEFRSKEQLKKCYAISEDKFSELEPYIILPEHNENQFTQNSRKKFSNDQGFSNFPPFSTRKDHQLKISGKFNPDHYSEADFINMGFTEKQAGSIMKYKRYLGGSFISKDKLKACFVISDENYRKMEPYLLLPDTAPNNVTPKINTQNIVTREIVKIQYQNFDPNETDFEGWKNLGFTDKQAQTIINYRDRYLKGRFKTIDEIANCYAISPDKFEEMKPFMQLKSEIPIKTEIRKNQPYSSENIKTSTAEAVTDFSKTDLNEITYKQLIEYGFDEKSAASYIGFRNKLGGFVNKNQILDTYNIDKVLIQRLIYIAPLYTQNVQKYSLMNAPEPWLKNHPYFKYYADKIIYYRISFNDEKKFFRMMKVKPEYEAKMRLYLQ